VATGVVEQVAERLTGVVAIYGPNGETLLEVYVPEEDHPAGS
jgi:hypothetical protein